jgi:DNA-binding LacI/PurR family transcriptional regulator
MKITLNDIAVDTGFAISTISRVLNGSDKISDNTKRKVLASAEKLGYTFTRYGTHNRIDTLNVALIASGFHEGEFYSSFFHGLNKASAQNNVNLFLNAILDNQEDLPTLLSNLCSTYFDGIVLFIPELLRTDYEAIAKSIPTDYPIISNSLIENPIFPTVTFDSYSGGYLAAQHFQKQGYNKVGIITGPPERSESRFRKNGFLDFISQNSDLECVWCSNGDFTYESGVSTFWQFHNKEIKPDAIFASNDSMAQAFLELAKENGYSIPKDIAIIGYDNLPHNKYTNPTLSSIQTDYEKLGNTTIKALMERISKTSNSSGLLSFVPVTVSHKESS